MNGLLRSLFARFRFVGKQAKRRRVGLRRKRLLAGFSSSWNHVEQLEQRQLMATLLAISDLVYDPTPTLASSGDEAVVGTITSEQLNETDVRVTYAIDAAYAAAYDITSVRTKINGGAAGDVSSGLLPIDTNSYSQTITLPASATVNSISAEASLDFLDLSVFNAALPTMGVTQVFTGTSFTPSSYLATQAFTAEVPLATDAVADTVTTPSTATNWPTGTAVRVFTGFGVGATPSSTDTATSTLTFAVAHGVAAGGRVVPSTTSGGLVAGTTYYARVLSATTLSLYNTAANATAASGTTGLIALTGPITSKLYGTSDTGFGASPTLSIANSSLSFFVRNVGTNTYQFYDSLVNATGTGTTGLRDVLGELPTDGSMVIVGPNAALPFLGMQPIDPCYKPSATNIVTETITFSTDPNWATGTAVRTTVSGGGLAAGTTYYVRNDGDGNYRLYTSQSSAVSGVGPVNLNAAVTGGFFTNLNSVSFAVPHKLTTGDMVRLSASSGGLATGIAYYARVIDASTISLHSTAAAAISGTAPLTLTSPITSAIGRSTPGWCSDHDRDVASDGREYISRIWSSYQTELFPFTGTDRRDTNANESGVVPSNGYLVVSSTDITADSITFSAAHGMSSGLPVQVTSSSDVLSPSQNYFVRVSSANVITLHPTASDALSNTNRINLTATINGATFFKSGAIDFTTAPGWINGMRIVVTENAGGLDVNSSYYLGGVSSSAGKSFTLHLTQSDALSGNNSVIITDALPATLKVATYEFLVEKPENLDAVNYLVNYAPMTRLSVGRSASSTTIANGAPVASTSFANSGITPTSTNVTAGVETVTFAAVHGFSTGDPVRVTATGGGLNVLTTYYARAINDTTISFYSSADAAIAGGTTGLVNLSANITAAVYNAALTGTHDTITFAPGHGFQTGDAVTISATAGGLTSGTMYRLYQVTGDTFSVHTGAPTAANKVDLTASISGTFSANVAAVSDYDWSTGLAVQVSETGGGLTANTTYYVRAVTSNLLAFYNSSSDAANDQNRIDLTGPVAGLVRPFYSTMDQQHAAWELIENRPSLVVANRRDRLNELLGQVSTVVPLGQSSIDYIPPKNGVFVILTQPVERNVDSGLFASVAQMTMTTMPVAAIPGYTKQSTVLKQQTPAEPTARLGDFVWEDLNADGQQDYTEIGIESVTVNLLDDQGNLLTSAATDGSGHYDFPSLEPGTYTVEFLSPNGFIASPSDQGDDATDSDSVNGFAGPYTLLDGEENLTVDAGFYRSASLGDYVWLDTNADGQQSASESGLANVTVELLDAAGSVLGTTTTDADGAYEFTGLTPGSYRVRFTTPNNLIASPSNSGDDTSDSDAVNGTSQLVTLVSGESNRTIDAGFYQLTSLGDLVWEDLNANGQQDEGEPGIASVTVSLLDTSGNLIATAVTDASGNYLFSGLLPGSYQVGFETPLGYQATVSDEGDDATDSDAVAGVSGIYTVMADQSDISIDAGFYRLASLGDWVWEDLDGDGLQEPDANGIEGVTVNLLDANSQFLATTTTDADGKYGFYNLVPGSYRVEFVKPTGFQSTPSNAGTNDAIDSDPIEGVTGVYTLASGEANLTIDAGFFGCTTLGNFVWEDLNANGLQDEGEPGIDGVTVNLYDENGDIVQTRITENGGEYLFTNLWPGQYQVEFVAPEGYTTTTANAGDDELDSDAVNGLSDVVTLASCGQDLTIDAGYYRLASLGDFVWVDANANGQQDDGEPGLSGVTVKLLDNSDNELAVTVTSATGAYSFANLLPGSYKVQFETPNGYVATTSNSGDDASDSDSVGGVTGVYTLASGDSDLTVDAGFYQYASLGDFVWVDANANGQQDQNEPGLVGVTVDLLDVDGNPVATTTTGAVGDYLFSNLVPGSYSVRFTTPSGYVATSADSGDDATDSDAVEGVTGSYTLASGDSNLTVDAGFYQYASLGDFVWRDNNANGQQDAGEPGLAGVTVDLLDIDGNEVDSTTTDAAGGYWFLSLIPGTYQVRFSTPTGLVAAPSNSGDDATDSDAVDGLSGTYTLTSGDANMTVDAGFYACASLGDFVWVDANANGQQDSGESGLGDVTVNLLDENDNVIATTTTSAAGEYLFSNLVPGSYKVQFVTPSGYVATTADSGDDASDSDPVDGVTSVYTLACGDAINTVDAGFYQYASLGDFVWVDANTNGQQDAGENGLSGVTVKLLDAGANELASTTTNASGGYLFSNLVPGSYKVQFVTPTGYAATTANTGSDATDSDAVGGVTGTYTLTSGQSNMTVDAGFYSDALGNQDGRTIGYYSNKNGRSDLTGSTTGTTLKSTIFTPLFGSSTAKFAKDGTFSVLVDANGNYLQLSYFSSYANIRAFLLGATATNMANMLSVQMLATQFNTMLGRVNAQSTLLVSAIEVVASSTKMSAGMQTSLTVQGSDVTGWTQVTTTVGGRAVVQTALDAAVLQLKTNPKTISSGGNRLNQEAIKNIFDAINNNQSIF